MERSQELRRLQQTLEDRELTPRSAGAVIRRLPSQYELSVAGRFTRRDFDFWLSMVALGLALAVIAYLLGIRVF